MTTQRTHALPWTFRQFWADLFPGRRPATPAHDLTGREATARHLFGEAVQWSRLDMAEYDAEPYLQEAWLAEADRRIAGGRGVDIADLIVLRHWGYTPAEWNALPSLVQVDKRESFFQANGLAS
jgi:hypothetical protein